ncbi:hypothetical protein E2C01_021572 [Portunus trituberculatus]|uniref:Uncharacterized protein n=1 Tax=Portunus trituberculatus TaxID=210409 RepID=A0A5B7E4L7_PORTR|nr:hypothetical protein [Portunus trituberculatus]
MFVSVLAYQIVQQTGGCQLARVWGGGRDVGVGCIGGTEEKEEQEAMQQTGETSASMGVRSYVHTELKFALSNMCANYVIHVRLNYYDIRKRKREIAAKLIQLPYIKCRTDQVQHYDSQACPIRFTSFP